MCQKILSQIIINKTAQERGITVTPEEVDIKAIRLRDEQRRENLANTQAWLAVEDWKAGIRDCLLAQKLAESLFPTKIENFFDQNRPHSDQVILYQIIVPYERVAHDILYKIEEEEISFYEAAHFYDIDERRRYHCGYKGKLYRWHLKPDKAAVVFSANTGELIDPMTTKQGSHILIVEEFIPDQLTPQRYQGILNQMFKEWIENQVDRTCSLTEKIKYAVLILRH
ncbi:peptidylprolyl isomerase [Scytonema sp. UIC 10036]|uniref:peptidylprolyl isomerase n=1 Tax=Scytonema sp. UIC 10036 TaxID=2304196 RepID=UPI00325BC977